MELANKFILSVFISTLFFTEALCLPRKLGFVSGNKIVVGFHVGTHVIRPGLSLDSICAKTDYAPLCISSLRPKLHGQVNLLAALKAEIDATAVKVKKAMAHLAQLEHEPSISKGSLSVCKEQYEFAIDSLLQAKLSINKHDIGSIYSQLSAVTTYAGTCDDAFTETPGETSPLANFDAEVSHLGSNCLAIAELLKW